MDDFTTEMKRDAKYALASTCTPREAYVLGALDARSHLARQEPSEDEVQAAVAAILALTGETEETARMDDIDVAWDLARAAFTAARSVGRDAR